MARTKQFKEEEALQSAMTLFWKKGFHATSMQDLVDTMGINRASMYNTFGDKNALYNKAFEKYQAMARRRIDAMLNEHDSVKDTLQAMFLGAIKESTADSDRKGCFIVNAATELASQNEVMCQTIEGNRRIVEEAFGDLIQKGITSGEISPKRDPKAIASFLFMFYSGLQVIIKTNPNKDELTKAVETALLVLN